MCVTASQLSMHRANFSSRVIPPVTTLSGVVDLPPPSCPLFVAGPAGLAICARQGPLQQIQTAKLTKSLCNNNPRMTMLISLEARIGASILDYRASGPRLARRPIKAHSK
jgi:hypothetical protein